MLSEPPWKSKIIKICGQRIFKKVILLICLWIYEDIESGEQSWDYNTAEEREQSSRGGGEGETPLWFILK